LEGRGCASLEGLGLSEEQRASIQKIEALYWNEIGSRREKMMIKHIELQALLRDPNVSAQTIRQKSRDIGDLQAEIRERMIDYQIEIRSILTPDQRRQWCTLVGESALKKGWRGGL
jgi:Spy/CpxP family protein refolding chaperone